MSIRSMPSNEKFRKNYDRVFRRGITHIKPSWTPVFTDDDGNVIKPREVKVESYLVGDPEPKTIEWTVLNDPSDWSIPQKRRVKK
jgi:hypothetical protein